MSALRHNHNNYEVIMGFNSWFDACIRFSIMPQVLKCMRVNERVKCAIASVYIIVSFSYSDNGNITFHVNCVDETALIIQIMQRIFLWIASRIV